MTVTPTLSNARSLKKAGDPASAETILRVIINAGGNHPDYCDARWELRSLIEDERRREQQQLGNYDVGREKAWEKDGYDHARLYRPVSDPARGPGDQQVWPRFKDGDAECIEIAAHELAQRLRLLRTKERLPLALVPGHEASGTNARRPLAAVIKKLLRSMPEHFEDGSELLLRIETIVPAHISGYRSIEIHKRTIRASRAPDISGRRVMILDDVVTTGTTLEACRRLLVEVGAREVCAIAWAKTQRTSMR
jgi:phosphoribosylpyrophosphate synthetase